MAVHDQVITERRMKIPDCQMPGPGDPATWPLGTTPEPFDESEREDELLQMSHAELIAIVMELEDRLARAQRFNVSPPREPTKAMFDAGIQVWKDFAASPRGTFPTPADVWRAMHDAAPK